jgi:OOP family OmpA-OmpF porin
MGIRRLCLRLAAGASVLFGTNVVSADVPSLDLRGFNPPADPNGGLRFEPAASPDTLEWNAALWASYSYNSVTLRDPVADEVAFKVLEHQLSGDLLFNLGLFERVAVGIDMPFVMYQEGDDPADPANVGATEVLGDYELPATGLGDIKLMLKGTLIKPTNGEFGGFAMALTERLGFPTGNQQSYLGDGNIASESRLLLEYRYLALAIHAGAGVLVRGSEEEFGCKAARAQAEASGQGFDCATTFGHELPWNLALVFKPQAIGLDDDGHWSWFIESYGYVPVSPEAPFTNAAVSQAQLGGGVRYTLDNDMSLLAGLDTALLSGIGNAPVRATLSIQWAPRKHDDDDDGVRDDVDLCPDLVEDVDGFEDADGCPEWDNDDDGVPDESDRCPREQEDEDGFNDDDGCIDADNDGDNVLDDADACPDVPGIQSDDPKQRGCSDRDADRDLVDIDKDKCPNEKEDKDGFKDEDGCPDPDNDGDGIADTQDACPDLAGVTFADKPADNGCPDTDGDSISDGKDACPNEKGVPNEDAKKNGCAEDGDAKPGKKPDLKKPGPKKPGPKAPKAPAPKAPVPKAPGKAGGR